MCIFNSSAGRTTHQDGEALKNLALKKGSIQSRKLWNECNDTDYFREAVSACEQRLRKQSWSRCIHLKAN
nr:MAG TPA: hypothetical protein [Caudoviricetes sp.]